MCIRDRAFTVQLRVRSHDRKFLLSDISKALGDSGCNIQSATTSTLGQIAEQDFWVDVVDITHLQHAMEKANKIEGVLEVLRIDETFDEHNQASKNWVVLVQKRSELSDYRTQFSRQFRTSQVASRLLLCPAPYNSQLHPADGQWLRALQSTPELVDKAHRIRPKYGLFPRNNALNLAGSQRKF